ncbi:RING/U-box superfamily protein [Striga asiatica]|uniref:RING/U-box superfamily protein n=1 Tax=Striga asiatica TaxID=4170 RepID=A0A5A7PWS6_STRAF|nr:RING/U-box superfamily protein [Striga asiatica]
MVSLDDRRSRRGPSCQRPLDNFNLIRVGGGGLASWRAIFGCGASPSSWWPWLGEAFLASRGLLLAVYSKLCLSSCLGPESHSKLTLGSNRFLVLGSMGSIYWGCLGLGWGGAAVIDACVACGEKPEFSNSNCFWKVSCYVFGAAALGPGVADLLAGRKKEEESISLLESTSKERERERERDAWIEARSLLNTVALGSQRGSREALGSRLCAWGSRWWSLVVRSRLPLGDAWSPVGGSDLVRSLLGKTQLVVAESSRISADLVSYFSCLLSDDHCWVHVLLVALGSDATALPGCSRHGAITGCGLSSYGRETRPRVLDVEGGSHSKDGVQRSSVARERGKDVGRARVASRLARGGCAALVRARGWQRWRARRVVQRGIFPAVWPSFFGEKL